MDTINKFQLGQTVYFAEADAVNECTVKGIDLDAKGTVNYLLKGGAYERYATENRLSRTAREALIEYYTFHKNKLSEKLEQTKKELAEIKGKQDVAVAELEKQKAAIEANKKLEIVEIQKKEEKAKLEVIQIQAEQKVAEAKAKEQQIKLSGAISEEMKYRLDIEKETKIGVAKAIAEGISNVKLPSTFIMGGTGTSNVSPVETFFNLMNVQKAAEINKAVAK